MRALPSEWLASNLPAPRTRLIGREAEIAAACAFLLDAAVPSSPSPVPVGLARRTSRWSSRRKSWMHSPMALSGSILLRCPISMRS